MCVCVCESPRIVTPPLYHISQLLPVRSHSYGNCVSVSVCVVVQAMSCACVLRVCVCVPVCVCVYKLCPSDVVCSMIS